MEKDSDIVSYEIESLIQNAANDGRNHLNNEEATHLMHMTEKLVLKYVRELQDLYDEWFWSCLNLKRPKIGYNLTQNKKPTLAAP